MLAEFEDVAFRFMRYGQNTLKLAEAGSDYGNAFIHPEYIRRNWVGEKFELMEHIPGGMRGWQDIVVLRRRTEA